MFQWIPYSAEVCVQLERAAGKHLTSLFLGDIDPKLRCYTVNFVKLEQSRKDTGMVRPIQQQQYSIGSCPGQGIYWQWLGDQACWCSYSVIIQDAIEDAHNKGMSSLDLEQFSAYLPYTIDFKSLTQIRKLTKYRRRIQRITGRPYPVSSSSSLSASSGNGNLASQNVPLVAALFSGLNVTAVPLTNSASLIGNGTVKTVVNGAASANPSKFMSWIHSKLKAQTSDPTPTTSSNPVPANSVKPKPRKTQSLKIQDKYFIVENVPRSQYMLSADSIFEKYTKLAELEEKADCPICCDDLASQSAYNDTDGTAVSFIKCGHSFHSACLKEMLNNSSSDTYVQCPTCKEIYGIKIGNQPPGEMKYYIFHRPLPGFNCDTICIVYTFRSGYQTEEHPHPGQPYSASTFPRECYLPNNDKGRLILSLLCIAWKRRLTFTIGTSVTTGATNVVTWNEIHHKTEFGANYYGHGYPDDNYFDNVLSELAAQGIKEDDCDADY